jgi:putative transferase (TIGR04331 family)
MSTYLITSSEEQSWPNKEDKVLFLGEWCKRHNRKNIWSNFKSITAKPYVIYDEDIRRLNEYSYELYDILLSELVIELNHVHNVNNSKRYWNILLGRWLRQHIVLVINRYSALESAIKNYSFDKTIILDYPKNALSTSSYSTFISSVALDALWNHWLYSDMLENWPKLNIQYIKKKVKLKTSQTSHKEKNKQNLKQQIKKLIIILVKKLVIFKRENDAIIIKSYLTKFQEIKLQLSLGQFPQMWDTPEVNESIVNQEIRGKFFQKYNEFQGLDREIRRLLSVLIPVCYLEGYKSTQEQSEKLPWPKTPKFIYTSNSFGSDELFRFWTAKKTESGIPYYVGQHGNNYGTIEGSQIWNEITTCDKFFSWGWDNVYHGCESIPAFVYSVSNKKRVQVNEKGGLLIVGDTPGPQRQCYDYCNFHERYQDYLVRFLNTLDVSIQNNTTTRLHGGSLRYESSDAYILETHYPNITIDFGLIKIHEAILKNRLTVYSYDSTGILESLSLNIPTVAFWHGDLNHILSDAIPYYELLIDAEILHLNPENASNHVAKHWDNIDLWWASKRVQDARKIFCDKYARTAKNPVLKLRGLLLKS